MYSEEHHKILGKKVDGLGKVPRHWVPTGSKLRSEDHGEVGVHLESVQDLVGPRYWGL